MLSCKICDLRNLFKIFRKSDRINPIFQDLGNWSVYLSVCRIREINFQFTHVNYLLLSKLHMWIKYVHINHNKTWHFSFNKTYVKKIFVGWNQNQYLLVLPTLGMIYFGEINEDTVGGKRNRCTEWICGLDQRFYWRKKRFLYHPVQLLPQILVKASCFFPCIMF